MNKNRNIIIICTTLAILLLAGGFLTNSVIKSQEVQKQVDLGNKYIQEGNYEQAILAYNEAIAVDPKNIPARTGLTVVYIETGEFDEASRVIEEIGALGYKKVTAADSIRIADAYLKYGRLGEAVQLLQSVFKANNDPAIKSKMDELANSSAIVIAIANPSLASGDATFIKLQCQDKNGQEHAVKAEWKQAPELGTLTENADGSITYTASKEGDTTLTADICGVTWTTMIRISAINIGGLTASAQSYNAIILSWDVNPRAAGYKIFRSDSQVGQYLELATVNDNSYLDSGLNPDTAYWYRVQAIAANGSGSMSADVSAKTNAVDERQALLDQARQDTADSPQDYRLDIVSFSQDSARVSMSPDLHDGNSYSPYCIATYRHTGPGQWLLESWEDQTAWLNY